MYRVMIADADLTYCEVIQGWILEKYGAEIEMEIITERSYYTETFKTRHELDLMIVSRDFYTLYSPRGYVPRIVVLEENADDFRDPETAGVFHIDKYSNTQGILYTLESLIDGDFRKSGRSEQRTRLLLITSASGGVGKTTIGLGLCAAMQRMGKKVLYIDAEYLQTFSRYLEDAGPITSDAFYEALAKGRPFIKQMLGEVCRKEGFSYLPPFKKALISLDKDLSLFTEIIREAVDSGEFDYVTVDSGNEFSLEKAKWLSMADKVVIVKMTDARCEYDYEVMKREISDIEDRKYIVVNNKEENGSDSREERRKEEYSVRRFSGDQDMRIRALGCDEDIVKICYLL